MATFQYGEQDILQKYRDSVNNNRQEIIDCLRTGFWGPGLIGIHCLTEDEWGTIEEKSGSGRDKRTNKATAILDLIIRKDSCSCYRGFSRVFFDKKESTATRIFPFIKQLKEAGLHMQWSPPPVPKSVTVSTTHPILLWSLSSQNECEIVTGELKLTSSNTTDRCGFHCQEFSVNEATLFLTYPNKPFDGRCNPFTSLLSSLHPRLAVMTGTCTPVRGNTTLTPGQVVLMTTKEPRSITGEVGFMCELWKLNNTISSPVVCGRATKWGADDCSLVQCRDAVYFYNAAAKLDNLEYFSLLQVQVEDQSHVAASLGRKVDSLQLMCELVRYFSDNRI